MPKRRASLVDVFLVRPWWFSVIAAGAAYALLAFGAAHLARYQFTVGISIVLRHSAPYVAAFFLSIACLAVLRAFLVKRKFQRLESIERIRQLSWRQFEAIVAEAFRREEYGVDENAVEGPDGGIDLVLRRHGATFYVQCKQWKQRRVGVKPIRELFGVIAASGAAGGFFVASGEYTQEAREFARRCGIQLIDGAALIQIIAQVRNPDQRAQRAIQSHPRRRGTKPS